MRACAVPWFFEILQSEKRHAHALIFHCILKSAHVHYETSKKVGMALYGRDCAKLL